VIRSNSRSHLGRRDFIKGALAGGSLAWLNAVGAGAPRVRERSKVPRSDIRYKFRTMSVEHLPRLQEDIDQLRRENKLSPHPVFRSYIDPMKFILPKDFPRARSVIVMAVFTRAMTATFHLDGRGHEVVIPPQYYDDGISLEDLNGIVRDEIIGGPGPRVERAKGFHLKPLAVRSGLGRYGRNNICFVDGFGTYVTLYGFLTDHSFPDDHWGELALMEACRECPLCYSLCPTGAIRKENFVIDVGRCITLYGEIDGTFPNFILPSMHNALMGCLACQARCPVNEKVPGNMGRFEEDVTEDETRRILAGTPDEELLKSLTRKLKGFGPATSKEQFPIFTRNLRPLIRKA
jgi:epoxyqueuosine reductase